MPRIRIDSAEFAVPAGLTVLQAARSHGIDIPYLCFADGCTAETSCLVCLVRIDGVRRLMPSCATVVSEGMIIHSNTPEVREARKTALELILSQHSGDCFAPCANICPAHLDIPGMVRAFSAGDLREAAGLARGALVLPATLGALCEGLCEKACRRDSSGGAVAIHALHRHIAELDLAARDPWLPALPPARAPRIAVVGAGPTGLAAAYQLRKLGHPVEVFDRRNAAGGTLRDAAESRGFPLATLDAEIALLSRMGIVFHHSVSAGRDLPLAQLQQDFAAVLLACGAMSEDEAAALGLPRSLDGRQPDSHTYQLSSQGIFVAGAAAAHVEHAIRAIAEGQAAGRAIHAVLTDQLPPSRQRFSVRLGKLAPDELSSLLATANLQPRLLDEQQPTTPLAALCEASRCANCGCDAVAWCRLRKYAVEYQCDVHHYRRQRPPFKRIVTPAMVTFEPGKCIACGLCVQVARKHQEELGLTFIGRGFDLHIGVPFDEPLEQGLRKCAKEACAICPTGALTHPAQPPEAR